MSSLSFSLNDASSPPGGGAGLDSRPAGDRCLGRWPVHPARAWLGAAVDGRLPSSRLVASTDGIALRQLLRKARRLARQSGMRGLVVRGPATSTLRRRLGLFLGRDSYPTVGTEPTAIPRGRVLRIRYLAVCIFTAPLY